MSQAANPNPNPTRVEGHVYSASDNTSGSAVENGASAALFNDIDFSTFKDIGSNVIDAVANNSAVQAVSEAVTSSPAYQAVRSMIDDFRIEQNEQNTPTLAYDGNGRLTQIQKPLGKERSILIKETDVSSHDPESKIQAPPQQSDVRSMPRKNVFEALDMKKESLREEMDKMDEGPLKNLMSEAVNLSNGEELSVDRLRSLAMKASDSLEGLKTDSEAVEQFEKISDQLKRDFGVDVKLGDGLSISTTGENGVEIKVSSSGNLSAVQKTPDGPKEISAEKALEVIKRTAMNTALQPGPSSKGNEPKPIRDLKRPGTDPHRRY